MAYDKTYKQRIASVWVCDDEKTTMCFTYSVTASLRINGWIYGVCIDKYEYNQYSLVFIESETAPDLGIFNSWNLAVKVATKIASLTVTPCTLLAIMDDLMPYHLESFANSDNFIDIPAV